MAQPFIYGGEISNNIQEVYIDKNSKESILPENMEKDYIFDIKGVGIYLICAKLYMYGGVIYNNEGINNTDIYSNKNSTNSINSNLYGLYQTCSGIGIYGQSYSKIYLYKGEISNNYARNNAKSNLISPIEKTKTSLNVINNSIYGPAINFTNSEFEMFNDFIIQNNFSLLNTTINIEKNCKISNAIYNSIKGGQIYTSASQIKIHGGIIQNSNNIQNRNIIIAPEEEEIQKSIDTSDYGGAIIFINCKDIEINNLKLEKNKSKYGGAIDLSNSSIKIINSELNNNFAEGYGGAIFSGTNCEIELYNTKILNNSTQDGSGGGIYAYGSLVIDGENSLISNNEAGTYGGGIMLKNKGIIKNCTICNNKAKLSGGGIYIDGNLLLEKAKIYGNSCNERGGGIYCRNILLYDKNKIDSMIYNNKAGKGGNNLNPEIY